MIRSIVSNFARALLKKKVFTLGSKDINIINNTIVYDNYKYLSFSKHKQEQKLLKVIHSENGLKARVGAVKEDSTTFEGRSYLKVFNQKMT